VFLLARALLAALLVLAAAACGRREQEVSLDAVRTLRSRVEGRFEAPADGRLREAQIDLYLRVRREAGPAGSNAEAARALGVSPAEFDWARGRIVEALLALDAQKATSSALESYGRSIAALREVRRGAGNAAPRDAAKLDGEIAALERERATLRASDPVAPGAAANAARIARRRTEIESVGP
jgi:hypothetical protein